MAFSEDISVRLGLDRQPFDKALKGAQGALSTFKGTLGALGASFSLGAFKGFIGSVLDMADGLTRQSEALQVSTDFLQTWQIAAEQSGSNAEEAGKALDKFTTKLAESGKSGADVEQEVRKLSDAIAAQPDPLKRAAMASDAFGEKLGVKLIPLLSGGKAALDAFAASANKLSAEEIKNIDDFGDRIGEVSRSLQITGGKALNWFFRMAEAAGAASTKFNWKTDTLSHFAAAMGEASVEIDRAAAATASDTEAKRRAAIATAALAQKTRDVAKAYQDAGIAQADADFEASTAAEQLNILLGFRKQLIADMGAKPEKSIDNAKRLAALAKLGVDIAKQQKEADNDRLKVLERQAQLLDAQNQIKAAGADLDAAKTDRSGSTLQELANATPETGVGARNVLVARQILAAEDFAQRARLNGRPDLAKKATDWALGLRQRLEPLIDSEKNPLKSIQENTAEAQKTLATLLEKASKDGLVIQPKNGK